MTSAQWVSLFAAMGQLALALSTLAQRRASPLKMPLSLLYLDVTAWTAASTFSRSKGGLLAAADHVLSPWTAPLALDFVLAFVGIRRASHLTRLAAFVLCGLVSASWLTRGFGAEWREVVQTGWGTWMVATSLPTMAFAVFALIRHRIRCSEPEERARTTLLLLVFGVGTVAGLSDLLDRFVPHWPALTNVTMLLCGAAMAFVTIRLRLLGTEISQRLIANTGIGTALVLAMCCLAFTLGGGSAVAALLLSTALLVAVGLAVRERVLAAATRVARQSELALLGRFSAQMDDHVRNPLAALKGAAQLLKRDLARPAPLINRMDFADLILNQVGRIEVICARYRRLSRLELHRADVDLNDVVDAVLTRQSAALPDSVVLERALAEGCLFCWADADLLATILENLTRNAVEAMPSGGTLTVRTTACPGRLPGAELEVQDTGSGMDARTLEFATDDFYTTKPNGSGFGLAFAKRVADAHGGSLRIRSQIGRGTVVSLWLPIQNPEQTSSDHVAR